MIEPDTQTVAVARDFSHQWPRILDTFAVNIRPRDQSQPMTDIEFVYWVDIIRIPYIDCHRHARVA